MANQWEYDYSHLYNSTRTSNPQTPPIDVNYTQRETQDAPPPVDAYAVSGHAQPAKTEKSTKKHGFGKRFAAGALAVVLCGGMGFGGGYLGTTLANRMNPPRTVLQQAPASKVDTQTAPQNGATANSMSVSDVAARVSPSVVEVTTESATMSNLFGQYVTSGAGSGVILSTDGYIITNNHVVSGASQIRVRLTDKSEHVATVVGTDTKTDIAVLKIEAKGLTPATLGNSDSLIVGEFALAVGNPLGQLGGTVTDGIISALNREVTVGNQSMTLLQTSAAISPGNSGGGLFNEKGELVGIVNAKSSGNSTEGLGFAIPINTAMEVAQQLMDNGYVTNRPALGITVVTVSDAQTAMQYGVSRPGVYVAKLNEGGAAEKAGLKVGDLFVSVNGAAISVSSDLTGALDKLNVGDAVELQVVREDKVITINVTLEQSARPKTAQSQDKQEQANDLPGFSNPFGN